MAITDSVHKYSRATFGNQRSLGEARNIVSVSYAYTNYKKRPSAATAAAVLAATAVVTGGSTFTTDNATFTNPDVPRAITVVIGGTAADVAAGTITVTGTNVEGKTITEDFTATVNTAETLTGAKAFKTVTSIAVPAQDGSGVTIAIGSSAKLGLFHRVPTSGVTYRVVTQTTGGTRAIQAAPSASAASITLVESNTITPATAMDGTKTVTVHYVFMNWALDPTNGNPDYGVSGN